MTEVTALEDLSPMDGITLLNSRELVVPGTKGAELLRYMDLKSFLTVPVEHCSLSFAVVVEYNSGFKVSFSGDCRPSSKFAAVGIDSDLLIHEATLPDEFPSHALQKKHSTFTEAIRVGRE
jgi:ribonuclease Z